MKRGWNGSQAWWLRRTIAGVAGAGVLWCALLPASAGDAEREMRRARGDKAGWLTNRFSISGMHCKDCAKGLTAELKLTPGVVKAVVSFTETLATVVYDSKRVESSALLKAIQEAGFRGTLITNVPASGAVVKTVAGSEPAAKVSPETGLP